MTKTGWLVTLNEEQPTLIEGMPWPFTWTTQRDRATGEVRRRGDGQPYTPAWRIGEDVFINYAGAERIVAWLILEELPQWNDEEQQFEMQSTVHVIDVDGTPLADVGVSGPVQGGRQRLTAEQRAAAIAALTDSAAYRFSQTVDAAARRAIETARRAGSLTF